MENEIDELIAAYDPDEWWCANCGETDCTYHGNCEKCGAHIEKLDAEGHIKAIKAMRDECNAMKEDLVTLTSTNNELTNEVMYLRKRLEACKPVDVDVDQDIADRINNAVYQMIEDRALTVGRETMEYMYHFGKYLVEKGIINGK